MRPVSRRHFISIAALAAVAGAGVCGIGGVAGILLIRRLRLAAVATATPAALPAATPFPIQIVARAAWQARPVDHEAVDEYGFATQENPAGWFVYPADLNSVYRTIAVHHSAFSTAELAATGLDYDTMLGLQELHQVRRKWADIGYHYGIAADGTIYEGRELGVRGANVENSNWGTLGVVLMGNFEEEAPAPAQIAALRTLMQWLKLRLPAITHLAAHSDFNAKTKCPGANLRGLLDPLAQEFGLLRGNSGYSAPPPGIFPTSTPTP
jgi:N-acetylmuramoyl-L-alanine amidase